jgi:hypothetical protein
MGNDTFNTSLNAEDRAIEQAEQGFSNPAADNMQFLQSTLEVMASESVGASSSYFNTTSKPSSTTSNSFGNSFPGLSPAYSGAGLLGAVAATDMAGLTSAMGMAAQVATTAPVVFGKNAVGDSAVLAATGNRTIATATSLSDQNSLQFSKANVDQNTNSFLSNEIAAYSVFPGNDEFPDASDSNDSLMSLIAGLGQNPTSENLQAAMDAISDQIELLNTTFGPVFDGLSGEIQSQIAVQDNLSSTDLGMSIFDDAGSVSSTLTDLIGSIDVANNPQLANLLNLDSTFDNISSLVGSLPDLDLSPVTNPVIDIVGGITEPIIDPITDIVGGITEPIIDPITDIVGGITEPIIDPITDIVGGITEPIIDPITDIVGGITEPIIDPITDIVGGITEPITEPILDVVDGLLPDLGLLSGLSSSGVNADGNDLLGSSNNGISSNAGADSGALNSLLGAFDPNK